MWIQFLTSFKKFASSVSILNPKLTKPCKEASFPSKHLQQLDEAYNIAKHCLRSAFDSLGDINLLEETVNDREFKFLSENAIHAVTCSNACLYFIGLLLYRNLHIVRKGSDSFSVTETQRHIIKYSKLYSAVLKRHVLKFYKKQICSYCANNFSIFFAKSQLPCSLGTQTLERKVGFPNELGKIHKEALRCFLKVFLVVARLSEMLSQADLLSVLENVLISALELQEFFVIAASDEYDKNSTGDQDDLGELFIHVLDWSIEVGLQDIEEALSCLLCHRYRCSTALLEKAGKVYSVRGYDFYKKGSYEIACRLFLKSCCLFVYLGSQGTYAGPLKLEKRFHTLLCSATRLEKLEKFASVIVSAIKLSKDMLSSVVNLITDVFVQRQCISGTGTRVLSQSALFKLISFEACVLISRAELNSYELLSVKHPDRRFHFRKVKENIINNILSFSREQLSLHATDSDSYESAICVQAEMLIEKAQLVVSNPELSSCDPESFCLQAITSLQARLIEYVGKPALHNLLAAAYLWRAVCLKRHLPDDDAGDKQAGVNLKLQLTDFFASLSASLDVWCSILDCPFESGGKFGTSQHSWVDLAFESACDISLSAFSGSFVDYEKTFRRLQLLLELCCTTNESLHERSLKILCIYCILVKRHYAENCENDTEAGKRWLERESLYCLQLSLLHCDTRQLHFPEPSSPCGTNTTSPLSQLDSVLALKNKILTSTVKFYSSEASSVYAEAVPFAILGKRVNAELLAANGCPSEALQEFSGALRVVHVKSSVGISVNLQTLRELTLLLLAYSELLSIRGLACEAYSCLTKAYCLSKAHTIITSMLPILTGLCHLEHHLGLKAQRKAHRLEAYHIYEQQLKANEATRKLCVAYAGSETPNLFLVDWFLYKLRELEDDLFFGQLSSDVHADALKDLEGLLQSSSFVLFRPLQTHLSLIKLFIKSSSHEEVVADQISDIEKALSYDFALSIIPVPTTFRPLFYARSYLLIGQLLLSCIRGRAFWNGFGKITFLYSSACNLFNLFRTL
ncbi:uncharacterized protein LOC135146288 isoform X2 [Zophobas morio]|uniref:uncharacterized protein LOC135146288 isoform X2 n=1 Tax=Zophobas morio TaxID=2755281 RepID=UPI003083939F